MEKGNIFIEHVIWDCIFTDKLIAFLVESEIVPCAENRRDVQMKNSTEGQVFPMKIIAHIRSDFPTKFGIPRQSGLVEQLKATVVFEPEYRNPDAFRGLEDFSHIWLVWEFSQAVREDWSPTVRPPSSGRQQASGRVCHPFPLPTQPHRTVLREAGRG